MPRCFPPSSGLFGKDARGEGDRKMWGGLVRVFGQRGHVLRARRVMSSIGVHEVL